MVARNRRGGRSHRQGADDLFSPTRYAIMMRRSAKQPPAVVRVKPKPKHSAWAAQLPRSICWPRGVRTSRRLVPKKEKQQ
jgi:hypothetical protein